MKKPKRRYGTGTVSRSGKRWQARLPDAKRTSLGYFDTEELAHRMLDIYLAETAKSGFMIGRGVTFGDYLQSFMEMRERSGRVRDIKSEWCWVNKHILSSEVAQMPIDEVTKKKVQIFVDELRRKLSHQSVKHCKRIMSQAFEEAIQDRICDINPTKKVVIKEDDSPEEPIHYLAPEEICKLFGSDILTRQQREIFAIAIQTGLRAGELFGLHWADVHLEGSNPYLVVRYSWDKPRAKNNRVQRVPLTPIAVGMFRSIEPTHQLVWPNPATKKMYSKTYAAGWPKVKAALGLNPKVTLHGLRHTCATSLLSGVFGPPMRLVEVRDVMRHSSVEQTEVYAKLLQKDLHASIALQTGWFGTEQKGAKTA